MSERLELVIVDRETREEAMRLLRTVRPGSRVEFKGPLRTIDQNRKVRAMLGRLETGESVATRSRRHAGLPPVARPSRRGSQGPHHPRRVRGGGHAPVTDHAPTFAAWYGVSAPAGRVCAALYSADTRPLTVADLTRKVPHALATVRAALAALCGAMDPGALVTDGIRYALTEEGMDDCYAAIADERARRAA